MTENMSQEPCNPNEMMIENSLRLMTIMSELSAEMISFILSSMTSLLKAQMPTVSILYEPSTRTSCAN